MSAHATAILLLTLGRLMAIATGAGQALFFIGKPPSVIHRVVGEELNLECEVGGLPQPHIQWLHGGRPVHQVSTFLSCIYHLAECTLLWTKVRVAFSEQYFLNSLNIRAS